MRNLSPIETSLRSLGYREEYGAPGWIRTSGLKIRSLVLYPAELRARGNALMTRRKALQGRTAARASARPFKTKKSPAQSAARPNGRPRLLRGPSKPKTPGAERRKAERPPALIARPFKTKNARTAARAYCAAPSKQRRPKAPSNIRRPSLPPWSGSTARSGWGIRPSTLPASLTIPAISRADPLTGSA